MLERASAVRLGLGGAQYGVMPNLKAVCMLKASVDVGCVCRGC